MEEYYIYMDETAKRLVRYVDLAKKCDDYKRVLTTYEEVKYGVELAAREDINELELMNNRDKFIRIANKVKVELGDDKFEYDFDRLNFTNPQKKEYKSWEDMI